jgi:primosomal protein N''
MTAEERIVWLEEQLRQALEQVQALQEQLATWDIRSNTCALTMNFTHLFSTLSA